VPEPRSQLFCITQLYVYLGLLDPRPPSLLPSQEATFAQNMLCCAKCSAVLCCAKCRAVLCCAGAATPPCRVSSSCQVLLLLNSLPSTSTRLHCWNNSYSTTSKRQPAAAAAAAVAEVDHHNSSSSSSSSNNKNQLEEEVMVLLLLQSLVLLESCSLHSSRLCLGSHWKVGGWVPDRGDIQGV